jgi:hypothetical protein
MASEEEAGVEEAVAGIVEEGRRRLARSSASSSCQIRGMAARGWREEVRYGGAGPCICGANSAGLRRLFCARWALPRSAEPGYQTTKSEKK